MTTSSIFKKKEIVILNHFTVRDTNLYVFRFISYLSAGLGVKAEVRIIK